MIQTADLRGDRLPPPKPPPPPNKASKQNFNAVHASVIMLHMEFFLLWVLETVTNLFNSPCIVLQKMLFDRDIFYRKSDVFRKQLLWMMHISLFGVYLLKEFGVRGEWCTSTVALF